LKSRITEEFVSLFNNYQEPLYSVRIGRGWRALGLLEEETVTWFWIGSHADYDRLIG